MPRFGAEQAVDQRHRAGLREQRPAQLLDQFSPNLLKQNAAAEARAAVEAQALGAKRQYIRKQAGPGAGTCRGTLPPIRKAKGLPSSATTEQQRQRQLGEANDDEEEEEGLGVEREDAAEGRDGGGERKEQAHGNAVGTKKKRRAKSRLDMIGVNDRFVEAAGEARVDFVVQRIQDGQDLNHVHTLLGYTALHAAADVAGARDGVNLGQLEIVYVLLQAGCRLNIQARSNGETALHRAAAAGRYRIVELLVNYGAKTLIKDREGRIALQLANMYDRPKCAMLLRAFPMVCRRVRVTQVEPRRLRLRWDPPRNFRQMACPVDAYKLRWREVTSECVLRPTHSRESAQTHARARTHAPVPVCRRCWERNQSSLKTLFLPSGGGRGGGGGGGGAGGSGVFFFFLLCVCGVICRHAFTNNGEGDDLDQQGGCFLPCPAGTPRTTPPSKSKSSTAATCASAQNSPSPWRCTVRGCVRSNVSASSLCLAIRCCCCCCCCC
jgi:hypothetical protein